MQSETRIFATTRVVGNGQYVGTFAQVVKASGLIAVTRIEGVGIVARATRCNGRDALCTVEDIDRQSQLNAAALRNVEVFDEFATEGRIGNSNGVIARGQVAQGRHLRLLGETVGVRPVEEVIARRAVDRETDRSVGSAVATCVGNVEVGNANGIRLLNGEIGGRRTSVEVGYGQEVRAARQPVLVRQGRGGAVAPLVSVGGRSSIDRYADAAVGGIVATHVRSAEGQQNFRRLPNAEGFEVGGTDHATGILRGLRFVVARSETGEVRIVQLGGDQYSVLEQFVGDVAGRVAQLQRGGSIHEIEAGGIGGRNGQLRRCRFVHIEIGNEGTAIQVGNGDAVISSRKIQ